MLYGTLYYCKLSILNPNYALGFFIFYKDLVLKLIQRLSLKDTAVEVAVN